MTKTELLKRLAPMAISLIVLVVVAFSCSAFTGNEKTATLSNPNDTIAELGNIEVTAEEVYERVVNQFGARELRQFVDYELLANGSKNYFEMAMNDADFDIEEFVQKATYNGYTYDQAITIYTEEQLADLEAGFADRIVYNGYKTLEEYKFDLYLEHARGLYTKDELIREDLVLISDLVLEFEANHYGEGSFVTIRVDTLEEARNLLAAEGILTDESGKFIEEYSNQSVLLAYVNIYNKVYAHRDELTLAEAIGGLNEDIIVNYDELSETQPELAEFLFRVLDTHGSFDPNTLIEYKTYTEPIQINTGSVGFYMAYKTGGDNQNAMITLLGDITDEEYEELKTKPYSELESTELLDEVYNEVLKKFMNSSAKITEQLTELYEEKELTIYDQYLKYNFDNIYAVTTNTEESNTLVFSLLDGSGNLLEVTPDEFFTTLEDHVAPIVMNILNARIATSDEDLYNEVVTDELTKEITNEIDVYKVNFQQDAYAGYGFSSADMNWEEFIYAAFQYRSELDLFESMLTSKVVEKFRIDMYTAEDLQDIYFDLMAEEFDNAFELDVKHFLVYVDNNEDGNPDLNSEINWTAEQSLLADELVNLLRAKLTELNDTEEISIDSLTLIEAEYQAASFETDPLSDNYSEWAKFKSNGLKLTVEDLSTVTRGKMVAEFDAELKVMYDAMVVEDLFNLISENNVVTEFGHHLIYSDKFYEKADAYPDDEKSLPSRLDIEAFNAEEFDNISSETLIFIAKYYTPVTNDYTEQYELVFFDEARAAYGTISFSDSKFTEDYNQLVAINKAASER